ASSCKVVAGQATVILHDAEMRPVDEVREASLFGLNRRRSEINEPPPALDIVGAVTLRAGALSVVGGEEIEHGSRGTFIAFRRLGAGQDEPRMDEFVLMAYRTVEDRGSLSIPAAT